MKKMFFATLIAMVLFASCENENVNVNESLITGETKSVFMKLEQASGVRAVTDKVTDYTVEFSSGFMYFVDASDNITKRFTISSATTAGNNLDINDLIEGLSDIVVPASSHNVYVVANVPTTVTLPDAGLYTAVEAKVIEAASQAGTIVDIGTEDFAIKGVMLYSDTPGTLAESAGVWKATVAPKQIANRLQITDITAKANSGLDGFRVAGIYVNYFYDEKTIGAAATSFINYGSVPANYAAGEGLYTSEGVFYDEPNVDATSLVVAAGSGMVWGYNLLAGATTPHIVIKLTNIQVSSDYDAPSYIADDTSVAFVTVKGFKNGGTDINFSNGGYVYTIAAGALQFGLSDITEIPEVQTIDTEVTVELTDWVPVSVTPVI